MCDIVDLAAERAAKDQMIEKVIKQIGATSLNYLHEHNKVSMEAILAAERCI